jgi:pyruvate dehydrogenase E1 component alpha subunit
MIIGNWVSGRNTILIGLVEQEDDKTFSVQLSDESFETYELDPPSYTLDTTKKELKQIYSDMVSVR